jgi:hypothetical protein
MWSTKMEWAGSAWTVILFNGEDRIAAISLDDWAELSATKYLIDDALVAAAQSRLASALPHPSKAGTSRLE